MLKDAGKTQEDIGRHIMAEILTFIRACSSKGLPSIAAGSPANSAKGTQQSLMSMMKAGPPTSKLSKEETVAAQTKAGAKRKR